jgi:hypothetical protein
MANKLLTITDITREALAVFHEKMQLGKIAVRKFESRFQKASGQIGNKTQIRKPAKHAVGTSANVSSLNADKIEDFVELVCDQRRNVKISFTSNELAMSIDDFSKQFLRPAISRLVREVEITGFKKLLAGPHLRAGRTVTGDIAFSDYVKMNALLTANFAPENRKLFACAADHAVIVDANKGLFQNSTEISKQYKEGYMGTSGGFDWISSESAGYITWAAAIPAAGTLTASPAEGATVLAVTGMGANAVVKAGTSYTVAGCYALDPETLTATNRLYSFVAASDVTLSGAGAGNITVVEPIYTVANTDADAGLTRANVSSVTLTGLAITPLEAGSVASKSASLIWGLTDQSIALATIELPNAKGGECKSENFEGIGLRIWSDSDFNTDTHLTRIDVQYGWSTALYREYAVATVGKAV